MDAFYMSNVAKIVKRTQRIYKRHSKRYSHLTEMSVMSKWLVVKQLTTSYCNQTRVNTYYFQVSFYSSYYTM